MASTQGNELQVQVLSVSKLTWPKNGIGARIGRLLGSGSTVGVSVKLALSGHRDLFTHEHSANVGDSVVTFERQTLTYKIRGVEEQLAVTVNLRHLDDEQASLQTVLGEGQVSYTPDFRDGEEHSISVCLSRDGAAAGEITLVVKLVEEIKPVTSGPSISQKMVNNLHAAPHDVVEKILDFFHVDGQGKNHGQKVEALVETFDDMERRRGGLLTSTYEAEIAVDPHAEPRCPGFGSRAMTKIGNLISVAQVAPRFMIPYARRDLSNTRDILVEWVKCRQEISVKAFEIGEYLNHEGRILSGINILGDVAVITREGFEVAAFVCMIIPETDGQASVFGVTSLAVGLGASIVSCVTQFIGANSAKEKKRTLFQQVALESALHRKAYLALHGRKEEVEPVTEDMPLEDLPADAQVDEHLQYSAVKIVNIVQKSFGVAEKSIGVGKSCESLVSSGKKIAGNDPSAAGKKMIQLAEEYSYEGKSPEEVAEMMIADPKRYVGPPPPGMILFDVINTTCLVRMVVREKHKTQYFTQQEPISLGGKYCEVSFQVQMRDEWHDVQEWDVANQMFKVPAKKQVYRLDGKKDFRWFHLEGKYPIKVVSVDDEHGPME